MATDTTQIRDTEPVPTTRLRNLRVDDDLWDEAQRIARDNRETLSAVMRRALVEYVKANGGDVRRVER